MEIRTTKSLVNGVYSVRFDLTLTDEENRLVNKFGDPDVNYGGTFNFTQTLFDDTITSAAGAVANRFDFPPGHPLEGIQESDVFIVKGTTPNAGTYSIQAGGIDSVGGTLLVNEAVISYSWPEYTKFERSASFTVPENNRKLRSGSGHTELFNSTSDADAELKAQQYAADMLVKLDLAITELTASSDGFSGVEVQTAP